MQIHKSPQLSTEAQPQIQTKGKKIAISIDRKTTIFDLSGYQEGTSMEPRGYLLTVSGGTENPIVHILWPYGDDATEEDKFPEPIMLEDVEKLPDGETVKVTFSAPPAPEPSMEERLTNAEDAALTALMISLNNVKEETP